MPDQYFARQPATPERHQEIEVSVRGRVLRATTSTGIFSPGRLDPGTAILLDAAPRPDGRGPLLDLGCGWGPLTIGLALDSPLATVYAVEVNERAAGLARRNAQAAGAANVIVCAPDDVPEDVTFRTIWSNPPIHVGKPALHAMLLRWLPRLQPGGEAWLVVQRNLGADSLCQWLAEELADGFDVAREASKRGYRVIRVCRDDATVTPT